MTAPLNEIEIYAAELARMEYDKIVFRPEGRENSITLSDFLALQAVMRASAPWITLYWDGPA